MVLMGQVYFKSAFTDPESFFDKNYVITFKVGELPDAKRPAMRRWLEDTIKGAVFINTRAYTPKTQDVDIAFEFENADDATLFKLTWV